MNAGPKKGQSARRPLRSPSSEACAARAVAVSPGRTPSTPASSSSLRPLISSLLAAYAVLRCIELVACPQASRTDRKGGVFHTLRGMVAPSDHLLAPKVHEHPRRQESAQRQDGVVAV